MRICALVGTITMAMFAAEAQKCPPIKCALIACLPPTTSVEQQYEDHKDAVFLGKVVERLNGVCQGSQVFYKVQVRRTFKSCPIEPVIVVELPCFAHELTVGTDYLFFAAKVTKITIGGLPHYATFGCDGVRNFAMGDYLNRRRNMIVCPDSGACLNGQPLVNCLIDPCTTASCEQGGTCVSTYCGGCDANFFNSEGLLILPCTPVGTLM